MDENQVKCLRQLGLSDYEARLYIILVKYGPSGSTELANKCGLAVSKIYDIARTLNSKSLIEFQDRPRKFRAISPSIALNGVISERKSQLKHLESLTTNMVDTLKPAYKLSNGVWASKGRKAFFFKLTELLDRATSSVGITMPYMLRHPSVDRALLAAAKRDICIRVISLGNVPLKTYSSHGIEVRPMPVSEKPAIGVSFDNEACIRIEDGIESEFIWSNSLQFVDVVRNYFESMWSSAVAVADSVMPSTPLAGNQISLAVS